MLPRNHPDRIRIVFDDHRLVANAGLLLPATLARHLGLGELVDYHLDLGMRAGAGEHRRQADDPGCVCAGGRRLHRRRRCVAHRGDGLHPGRHGQGAIHPGHLPAQLPVGPRPSTRPGEPGAAGTGLGRWGGTATRRSPSTSIPPSARPTDWPRRAPGKHVGHAPAPGMCLSRLARAAPTPPGAPPTFCGRRCGTLRRGPGATHGAGRQRLLHS